MTTMPPSTYQAIKERLRQLYNREPTHQEINDYAKRTMPIGESIYQITIITSPLRQYFLISDKVRVDLLLTTLPYRYYSAAHSFVLADYNEAAKQFIEARALYAQCSVQYLTDNWLHLEDLSWRKSNGWYTA